MSRSGTQWGVIALTCGPSAGCDALMRELKARQSKGLIPKETLILVIDDPVKGIGSGGATLNALLVIAENLASQAGYTVVNSDVFDNAHILILHVGKHYLFNGTGRGFINIPSSTKGGLSEGDNGLMTSLDHLIESMTNKVAAGGPPGVWICSTSMILTIPDDFKIRWEEHIDNADVVALSVNGDIIGAQEHGIYVTDKQGFVKDILYRSSSELLKEYSNADGSVNVVVGVVYINKKAAEKLLTFTTVSPLNSCTYVGIDSGAKAIQVSLFFDLLYAMCGKKSASSAVTVKMPAEQYQVKWRLLHKVLSDLTVKTVTVENGQFHYLFNNTTSFHGALKCLAGNKDSEQILVNSVVADGVEVPKSAYIANCRLTKHIKLSENVIACGLDCSIYQSCEVLCVEESIVYQHLRVRLNEDQEPLIIPVIFGANDSFEAAGSGSTFCNDTWQKFLTKAACLEDEIWSPQLKPEDRTLFKARLFPVMNLGDSNSIDSLMWMQSKSPVKPSVISRWRESWRLSLDDLLELVDYSGEFAWRRQLFAELTQTKVKDTIENQREFSLISLYKTVCSEQPEHCSSILDVLDSVAMETSSPGVAARALANVADVLGCMAGSQGGLRSGPSANAAWKNAYDLLERGEVRAGVSHLAVIRARWLARRDYLIRAARHYEGAAQILIRRAVLSATQFISVSPTAALPAMNRWVVGESPARVDIAGGWSDTPPISYEHGGAVANAAVLVDGMKPIGCKVRRIEAPQLVLVIKSGSEATTVTIRHMDELRDYYQPQSPGALLKTAFVCSNIVQLDSESSLDEQLMDRYGGGFELHTWSNLPHGSGLGTSSILAGAVMAVLWEVSGQTYTTSSIIHCVLHVEQMMTTGGGWQDQVGGLVPGIKIGFSKAELPLYVDYRPIDPPTGVLKDFNDRLLLIYTGKTRLARNILQNVVRNWYARDPHIVQTEDNLVKIAYECEEAFINGDLVRVGDLWSQYWQLKKRMATGCEPASVSHMIRILSPHVLSCCMAGAGGGGFLYVLTKQPHQKQLVEDLLSKLELSEEYSIHRGTVCTQGLSITYRDD